MNFAEPRTSDPWSWPDNRDEIPRVWNKTTGKMEPIDRPIIMYSSDSENNWDKNSGFFPPLSGKDFLNAFLKGREDYSQSGTDIPNFSTGSGGAFAAGSDFPGQGFGYQYQSPATIAGSPSFDMNKPYIPGQQDYTGIPNATPEMLRRLQQRKTRNPGGQEDLPGFLKPV